MRRRTCRSRRSRVNASGMALLEVILSLAILGFITVTLWGTFSRTYQTKRRTELAQERIHVARVALLRMTRELEMAYLSNHENNLIQDRRTMFVGTSNGGVDELQFSWFGKQRLRADAAEGDTALVQYYVAPDPEDPRVMNLMRRETRRLQAIDPRNVRGDAYIMCTGVRGLKFNYFDARLKEWRDTWTTTGGDAVDYLPTHVRMALTVLDERGREQTYISAARITMTEKVQHIPSFR